jgi:t-SNARE complex subunit (syntaxin)
LQQKKEQIWKRRTEEQFMVVKEKLKKYIQNHRRLQRKVQKHVTTLNLTDPK